ncbi:MAG TPA: tetratricopeptide repeat protein [Caulobacteraceae bacterium]
MKRFTTRTLLTTTATATAALAVSLAAPALAQRTPDLPQPAVPAPVAGEVLDNKGIERRLQRDEQALRELRQIVLQAKAQGNPVTVKDAGPDPEVERLQQRINELEETIRRQTGQMEEVSHNAQLAAQAADAANRNNQALAQRLDRIEQPLLAAGAAALAGQPGQPAGSGPQGAPPPPPPGGGGTLGALRGGPGGPREIEDNPQDTVGKGAAAAPEDEQGAYRNARKVLDSGDYAGGATALRDYIDHYPSSPRAPEANYWLGRTLAVQNQQAEAAGAYARALKGWPQTAWAGDAVVRLASSLVELKRGSDACKALAEFDSRYRSKATPQIRARAKDIGGQSSCS